MFAERMLRLPVATSPYAADHDFWYSPVGTPGTGPAITQNTAMTISTVFACVRVVAETLASLPLLTYERLPDGGKRRTRDHSLARLLHDQPNGRQTSMEFRELLTAWALLRGNGYAELVPEGGQPIGRMEPLHPDRVTVQQLTNGRLRYKVRDAHPVRVEREIPQERMFHLRGLSLDGTTGCSIIEYARTSMNLAKDAEVYGSSFIRNGSRPGVILKHPKTMSVEAGKRLLADFDAKSGPLGAGATRLVEEGIEVETLTLSNRDSQWLESRGFQREEICSWFRVPQHKVGILTRSTNNNIEHQAIEFVTDTIRPWAVRWEQAILRDMFYELNLANEEEVFAEHLIDGLLRGEIASRSAAYATGRQWGWFNVDEIRERENMNPLDDDMGKIYLQPMNMVPAGTEPADATEAAVEPDRAAAMKQGAYLLAHETAAALVKRECMAVVKAGQRHAGIEARDAFLAEVAEFYEDFVGVLTERLRLPVVAARAYCERHRAAVTADGVQASNAWDESATELAKCWLEQLEAVA